MYRFILSSSVVLLAVLQLQHQARADLLGGDAIGSDSSLTDFTGGVPAMQVGAVNHGEPAVAFSLSSPSNLSELRAIVIGIPSESGALRFDLFDYQVDLYSLSDYLSDAPPSTTTDIGEPENVTLTTVTEDVIVPSVEFGVTIEPLGSQPSYDLIFDLTEVPAFNDPIPAGDYILAFQSHHSPENGELYLSGSISEEGLVPYFSLDAVGAGPVERGVAGEQDPNNLELRWGLNLSIVGPDRLAGDYDDDGDVDGQDFLVWQRMHGETGSFPMEGINADGNNDGEVNEIDLAIWQDNYGSSPPPLEGSQAIPEPSSCLLLLSALLISSARMRR